MRKPEEILNKRGTKWKQDEYGIVLRPSDTIEVRLEPIFESQGAYYLAVYRQTELVGEKMPISLGTPGQRKEWK